jgi:hypothetical protein
MTVLNLLGKQVRTWSHVVTSGSRRDSFPELLSNSQGQPVLEENTKWIEQVFWDLGTFIHHNPGVESKLHL